jgi:hypothetical protein
MMRTMRRVVGWGCLVLVGLTGLTYAADDLWSRFRRRPIEQIKVDRIFADVNHWNQVEYSVGTPIMETCIDALMPHFGYAPCWYLRRHTIRQIGP